MVLSSTNSASSNSPMLSMSGQGVVKGITIGKAVVMGASTLEVPHYYVPIKDVNNECDRLLTAIEKASSELLSIIDMLPGDSPLELAPVLDVHRLLLQDPLLIDGSCELIRHHRYNAEWALATQGQALIEQFTSLSDEYMRERGGDIRQVIERVLAVLSGTADDLLANFSTHPDDQPRIVVARDIAPADMLRLRDGRFSAFLTDLGGPTSHTAIVARSMNVPAVVGLGSLRNLVRDGDTLVVDGETGAVFVNPTIQILQQYELLQKQYLQERETLALLVGAKAETLDGINVQLEANIELPEEADKALSSGAQGIGLFRTEFLFMGKKSLPSEEEQYLAYSSVVRTMAGKPVTIRTLDIGSDKTLDNESTVATNPALGLRAVRYCLDQPELFLTQLKAILRASAFGHIKVLIPMITSMQEVHAVFEAVSHAREALLISHPEIKPDFSVGAMVETPAMAIAVEPFAKALDFLSIGTNDLIQYTLAVDRTDPEVSSLYDPTHPSVLRLISNVINVGDRFGIPVSMCGEMAGEAQLTRLLLGLGLKSFSMHYQQILDVKKQVINSHSTELRYALASTLNHASRVDASVLNIHTK